MKRRRFVSWVWYNWFAGWGALFVSIAIHRHLYGADMDPVAAQWWARVGALLFFWWVAACFVLLFSMHLLEREYGAVVDDWQRRWSVTVKWLLRRCRRWMRRNGRWE